MDLLNIIKKDNDLHEKIMGFCDIEIYPEYQKPNDANGTMVWNIDGAACGCDASGGEYILLDDKSIGFNSSEGETGRIAGNITELFELLLNCSCWMDYLYIDLYKNDEMLEKYTLKMEADNKRRYTEIQDEDYAEAQNEILGKLSIKKIDDTMELLKRFYKTAIREPPYIYTFTEKGGSPIVSEGCIIDRPLYPRVKERMGLE
ncbi:MAG: hypothetical protein LBH21_00915 [Gracilibacteraceae bacterium]|jgi:hypothetical protein|nr:hypothetical protein [Gracilibacteraceae bacterium]